jgi:methyl-accepting chemotaxis protein
MAEAVQFFKEQAIKKLKKKAQEEEDIKRWQQEDAERLAREKEADGDLAYRIDTVFTPKTEKLRTDFNNAVEKLQQTMQGLRANIDAMHVGSGEISSAADDLSRRTEQPALNAGVEAVRAGDVGRGFAVVASEVRALAQRSAESAKEIKGLISASTAQVTQGVDLVGATGKALGRIVERVAEIGALRKPEPALAQDSQEESWGILMPEAPQPGFLPPRVIELPDVLDLKAATPLTVEFLSMWGRPLDVDSLARGAAWRCTSRA